MGNGQPEAPTVGPRHGSSAALWTCGRVSTRSGSLQEFQRVSHSQKSCSTTASCHFHFMAKGERSSIIDAVSGNGDRADVTEPLGPIDAIARDEDKQHCEESQGDEEDIDDKIVSERELDVEALRPMVPSGKCFSASTKRPLLLRSRYCRRGTTPYQDIKMTNGSLRANETRDQLARTNESAGLRAHGARFQGYVRASRNKSRATGTQQRRCRGQHLDAGEAEAFLCGAAVDGGASSESRSKTAGWISHVDGGQQAPAVYFYEDAVGCNGERWQAHDRGQASSGATGVAVSLCAPRVRAKGEAMPQTTKIVDSDHLRWFSTWRGLNVTVWRNGFTGARTAPIVAYWSDQWATTSVRSYGPRQEVQRSKPKLRHTRCCRV